MGRILLITASAGSEHSFSRRLASECIDHLRRLGYAGEFRCRDLATDRIPHISQKWIDADKRQPVERSEDDWRVLSVSDSLVKELHEADMIVLATPMYNWSIPGNLKAYLDQVLRFDETFTTAPTGSGKRYLGLLQNKILYLLFSRGSLGYGKGEKNEHMDFQSDYLRMVFGIMGIEEIYELAINGTKRNDPQLEVEMMLLQEQMKNQINALFNKINFK